ncbi:MAG TPA: hypothetical protein VGO68_16570 [Pyrinomonadaceae bacterium]|jgi:hypothetical protein|nr:hypothetical protein [Pyrinomonadaceae bacterium]
MLEQLLDQLDELKNRFGSSEYRAVEQILKRLTHQKFKDIDSLIHYHELLLFLNAYPGNARIRQLAGSQLQSFSNRVEALRNAEVNLAAFDNPEVSGIAGTYVVDTFTYSIVSWLLRRHPGQVKFDWDWFDDSNRLAETWPRFMPLLDEDAFVEANVPYQDWLRSAKGRAKELPWLFQRFAALKKSEREKSELYNSQNLFVSWTPGYNATRTGMQLPVKPRDVFYHRSPLIQRREVSLRDQLKQPSPVLERLSPKQGEAILDLTREASTLRYRELYAFTHGDPALVLKANIGRGVEIFVMGVPPERRLPLRACHAAMIFKNGVPVGYFEGLSIFERMESGFNLYYTFRDGETAWLYAHTLNIFHHLLGVSVFTLDPYQIGYENEEGIESGAFWFYRKFGFRPADPEVMKLVVNEEKKIATREGYRTPARTLRKLAESPMIFAETTSGDWDRFQLRNIGLAVQRRMAATHESDAEKFTSGAVKELARAIGLRTEAWPSAGLSALKDFACALSLVDDLRKWSAEEKRALAKIIRAKAASDESSYLKLMQKHARLRQAIIKLGSQ